MAQDPPRVDRTYQRSQEERGEERDKGENLSDSRSVLDYDGMFPIHIHHLQAMVNPTNFKMKTINTLVDDIYTLIQSKDRSWFDEKLAETLSSDISLRLQRSLVPGPQRSALRLSAMGPRCPRALWYSVHRPEMAEPIPPWATIKYTFGHIIESLAISLTKAAGHEVTGEQDELVLDGIVGHRDCVVDGCVVDVKSSSSRGFIKFKHKTLYQDDPFGYLDQLDGYVLASADDELVKVKDKGYILAIDKQLGHMVLYEHTIRPNDIRNRIREYKGIVRNTEAPDCNCRTLPEGKGGNLRLDIKASYSPYKYCCFPGLRTFAYSTGPVDLAKVVRLPDVPEIFRKRT
jgi:hypothetical protein